MPRRLLGRRLDGVGQALVPVDLVRFAVVLPESWPAGEFAAYEAAWAAGDRAAVTVMIWSKTGVRWASPVVEFRTRPDGPQ